MSKRRVAPLLVTVTLFSGALVGWHRTVTSQSTLAANPVVPATTARLAPVPASRIVEFLAPTDVSAAKGVAPVTLAADATTLTAEAIALQLLAENTELELTSRQWMAFAAVTANIQAVRQAYEASIATARVLEPGRYRMEIPVYAAAGDALRERFHAELREQLGEANAAEILARLGARLEGHFAGFGVSVQTLDITGDVRNASADCEVTRTVKFWNSVEGENHLTTRRETHFPAREDPVGESWGPLLSVLSAQMAETGS